jgi:hypothetical protein
MWRIFARYVTVARRGFPLHEPLNISFFIKKGQFDFLA